MKRQSIALFLSTVALAGGAVGCGKQPDGGEAGADHDQKQLSQPGKPAAVGTPQGSEGGEGGEGGEG